MQNIELRATVHGQTRLNQRKATKFWKASGRTIRLVGEFEVRFTPFHFRCKLHVLRAMPLSFGTEFANTGAEVPYISNTFHRGSNGHSVHYCILYEVVEALMRRALGWMCNLIVNSQNDHSCIQCSYHVLNLGSYT